jgi:hypothetical protein
MKTALTLVAALAFSASAMAQNNAPLTRAQVIAEYKAAQAAGTLLPAGENYPGPLVSTSTKTRAEVKEELRLALARGEVVSGEQYPFVESQQSTRTRAEVRDEVKQAVAAHMTMSEDGSYR